MHYEKLLELAESLPFVPNRDIAEAGVQAVLGILASKLDDRPARRLAENLPEPLSLQCLRGRRDATVPLPADEFLAAVARQFGIADDQARQLVETVWVGIRRGLPEDVRAEVMAGLPDDWAGLIETAPPVRA